MDRLFAFLSSLKVAVVIVLGLAAALAVGTVLESMYDTATGKYYVYNSLWFHLLLGSLGVNIFAVMVDRWPWKKHHGPFLLAHIGILMLLAGSWVTERFGLDGMMRVTEGETASVVEVDNPSLVLTEGDKVRKVPVTWLPPGVEFKGIDARDHGIPQDLRIDKFLSHAEPIYSFIPVKAPDPARAPLPAAKLRIQGGPMRITQDFWLWAGDRSFKTVQMGPSRFAIGTEILPPAQNGPSLQLVPQPGGSVSYRSHASDGKMSEGRIASDQTKDFAINPGWKGGVQLTLLEYVPDAEPMSVYEPARIQYGQSAPPAAIHVISGKGGEGAETWLGLGDRAVLHTGTGNVEIGFLPQRVVLPFSVRLDRFTITHNEGSLDPASYASRVTVYDEPGQQSGRGDVDISMNEPLTVKGITLYQASYEDAQPRPVTSVFSVNRDPGRPWKYWGSLLIVLGSIWLFAVKYRKGKAGQTQAARAAQAKRPAPVSSEVS